MSSHCLGPQLVPDIIGYMPKPLQKFVFRDFRGGLNTKDGPFELKDNEAQDLLNVTLTQRGALQKRFGLTRFNTTGFPANPARAEHLRAWYPGNNKFLMASINGSLYSFTTAGVGTLRVAGTAGTVWAMEQMQNTAGAEYLWAANGVDQARRLDAALNVVNWPDGDIGPAHILRVWKNRMVFVRVDNPMRLQFSGIGDPAWIDIDDNVDVKGSEEDVEPITWLEVLGDNLLVFKKNSVWSVYAGPPAIALKRLGAPGCEDRFQTSTIGDRTYWWARSGVWSTEGVNAPRYESRAIENFISDNHDYVQSSKVRVCASRDRRLFVSLALLGSTGNNQVLEMITDLGEKGKGPWVRHNLSLSSLCTFRPVEEDLLFGGASNVNWVYKVFVGLTDDGAAISSFWWSSWKSLFGEEPLERLRRVNLQMEGQASVGVYKDFEEVPSFVAALDSPGSYDALWDGGPWDGGSWDSGSATGFMRVRPETLARYHAIRVSNEDIEKPMNIFAIEWRVRGAKELHT